MVQFRDPETAKILPFLNPEIVKMDQQNSEVFEMEQFLDPKIVEMVDKSFMQAVSECPQRR